jgi:hypothetical protein
VTFYEYSAAVGVFDDPVFACAGVGIPLPINWSLPDRPLWGAEAKRIHRDFFNHRLAGRRAHRRRWAC